MKNDIFLSLILASLFITSCNRTLVLEDSISETSPAIAYSNVRGADSSIADSNFFIEEAFPNSEKTEIIYEDCLLLERKNDKYILQNDVVLDQVQVDGIVSALELSQRSIITSSFVKYWPKHKVYYIYGSGFTGQTIVQSAITEWQTKTGLDFVYGCGSGNYIEFQNNVGDGNYSNSIGMKGGKQIISLQTGGYNVGTVIHEIGHAVGLFHEHCRPDRDNYVIVNYNNVQSGKAAQFSIINTSDCVMPVPFDFNSVMLYGSFAFSSNGQATITDINGNIYYAQRSYLSNLDAEGAKSIYGPPYHKLVRTVLESEDYSSTTFESWSDISSYSVNFYSDKACLTPSILQYDRRLHVRKTIVRVDNGIRSYSYNDYVVSAPADSSSYFIGVAQTSMHSDYGIDSGIEEYYELLN